MLADFAFSSWTCGLSVGDYRENSLYAVMKRKKNRMVWWWWWWWWQWLDRQQIYVTMTSKQIQNKFFVLNMCISLYLFSPWLKGMYVQNFNHHIDFVLMFNTEVINQTDLVLAISTKVIFWNWFSVVLFNQHGSYVIKLILCWWLIQKLKYQIIKFCASAQIYI